MNFWLIEKRQSVKCHRHKCTECKNKSKMCGCECHVVIQKNEEKQLSDLQILDEKVCAAWKEFWRPFR